jgi:hypothetical protein
VTIDPRDAVSPSLRRVSVGGVQQLFAKIVALPVSPGRWLSDLMDDADDIWDLVDDDDLGSVSLPGGVNGFG